MRGKLVITPELLELYLTFRKENGLSASTLPSYQKKLNLLYELLPEDKTIRPGSIEEAAKQLEAKGYSAQYINVFLSAADGLVSHYGCYDLLTRGRRTVEQSTTPELTRTEYLRMLSTAKVLEKEKVYYLIKVFGALGINAQELKLLTIEAIHDGYFRSGDGMVRIPPSFQNELLSFAKRIGISSGPIFQTRNGNPLPRTVAYSMVASIHRDACIDPAKCNPRSLRKQYQSTQEQLMNRLRFLINQEYDMMLLQEDFTTGWDTESFGGKKNLRLRSNKDSSETPTERDENTSMNQISNSNSLRAFCERMGLDRILQEFSQEENLPLTPDTISYGSKHKVWWQCQEGHKWKSTVTVRTSGAGCPYCAGKLPVVGQTDLATTHPRLAAQWHPTKNGSLSPQQFTAGSNRKVWWKCDHGHEWEARISSRKRGIDCPICSGRMVVAGINDLATLMPELAREWDEENKLKPSQIRPYSNQRVWWRCDRGHRWQTTVNARCSHDSGCPYCMNRKVLTGYNDLATRKPDIAAQWHPSLNGNKTPDNILYGANQYAWWVCPSGHVWKAMIYSRTAKRKQTGCPICAGNISKKTRERYERIAAAVRQSEGK